MGFSPCIIPANQKSSVRLRFQGDVRIALRVRTRLQPGRTNVPNDGPSGPAFFPPKLNNTPSAPPQASHIYMNEETSVAGENLRAYPAPWKGELVLACRKCQKKQKAEGGQKNLARIGKRLGKMAKRSGLELHVVDVP